MTMSWEHFPHGADIGIRGKGRTLEEAYAQTALALIAVIADPHTIEPRTAITFRASAPDAELLLVDFLNELIYEMATRKMLFSRFDVQRNGTQLTATAQGEAVDIGRHQPAVEVKGATYTALDVHQESDGTWVAQCVVDV